MLELRESNTKKSDSDNNNQYADGCMYCVYENVVSGIGLYF